MSLNDIDVVLTWLDEETEHVVEDARAQVAAARAIDRRLDDLEWRAIVLGSRLCVPTPPPEAPSASAAPPTGEPDDAGWAATAASLQGPLVEWDELREQAASCLMSRGIDPATVDLDDLLDPDEVRRIERRFVGDFTIRTRLDRYDLAVMLIAGLTAALVDCLVMMTLTPESLKLFKPQKSGLTGFLRDHSVDSDNRSADHAKVPFDQQRYTRSDKQIPGFGPPTHRVLSLGHDPLLALVVGVKDIVCGTMTSIGTSGQLVTFTAKRAATGDPLGAVATVLLHLLSDAFTPAGLPAPGWTLLNALPFGSVGPDGATIAETARKMYTQGYDSRHFLTMSTSVAAAEVVLRAYWSLRLERDAQYAEDVLRESRAAASTAVSDHPRYQALAFGAHAAAGAANAGKMALSGNVLLFNYLGWTRFVQASVRLARTRATSPTDVLVRRGLTNAEALSEGWPELEVDHPALPDIHPDLDRAHHG